MKKLPFWFPYTQHGLLSEEDLLEIVKAEKEFLYTADGKKIIDAIASWWVNPYGHAHPYIAEALYKQAKKLEHCIFAGGIHHNVAKELSEKLLEITGKRYAKVFFSDNGSTSIEVALKVLFGYFYNKGITKTKILALEGAYHGDTFGAMAVSERGVFTKPYASLLFDVVYLPLPTKENIDRVEKLIEEHLKTGDFVGLIAEPLVQGAGGMRMYAPELLERIVKKVHELDHFFIADEVMTGFGRTGYLFATDSITEAPDVLCLSKALTAGFLPMSVTLVSEELFEAFFGNSKARMLFHGHSYTANPLGCAAALASLELIQSKEIKENIHRIEEKHSSVLEKFRKYQVVKEVRMQGTILAVELKSEEKEGYLDHRSQFIAKKSLEEGVLLRPLGNVIYVLPPYIISDESLQKVYETIEKILEELN